MDILSELLLDLPDEEVRAVLVGAHWTAVCSRHCGLASTILGDQPHAHEKVRDAGYLMEKSARELAEYARSDNLLEASIGVAAINSLLDVDQDELTEINAFDVLREQGAGRNIALVGHFPFIPELRKTAGELWVIEKNPVEGEYPEEAAGDLIPQADVVALTGSALINHTLDRLLSFCRPGAQVMVLGPSTPLSEVLFRHGATLLSGSIVVDDAAVFSTISQGATFQQVEGVRRVTMKP